MTTRILLGNNTDEGPINLVVIGNSACGKTALIEQFVHQFFPHGYTPTKNCRIYTTTVTVDDRRLFDMQIVDTPGLENFPVNSDQEWQMGLSGCGLRSADVYLVIFDLSMPTSCQNTQKLVAQIFDSRPDVIILVTGNKYDLLDDSTDKFPFQTALHCVDRNAISVNNLKTSAADLTSLNALFHLDTKHDRRIKNIFLSLDGNKKTSKHLLKRRKKNVEKLTEVPKKSLFCGKLGPLRKHSGETISQEEASPYMKNAHILPNTILHRMHLPSPTGYRNPNLSGDKKLPVLVCSAKYNWRVNAVFRQAMQTFEQQCGKSKDSTTSQSDNTVLANQNSPVASVKKTRRGDNFCSVQ